jgi:hypothetical protein
MGLTTMTTDISIRLAWLSPEPPIVLVYTLRWLRTSKFVHAGIIDLSSAKFERRIIQSRKHAAMTK